LPKRVLFAREVGVNASVLGFLLSIRNLLTGLFQGTIGRLSDKLGRKLILIAGFFLSFVIPIPLIFFDNTILLVFVALIQAFSISVTIPTWNAVLGDVTEINFRASFIGKITSVGRIASVAFTLLVAGLFTFVETQFGGKVQLGSFNFTLTLQLQYSIAFGISGFNALLCIIFLFFMRETHIVSKEKQQLIPRMWAAFKDKQFTKFLIINSFFGITMSLIWPANPIVLVDILDLNFTQVAVMSSSFAVFIGISQIVGGKICDKIGRKPLIIIAVFILVFFPVSMIPAIVTGNWIVLIVSRLVGGIGTGLNLVAVNAYTLDLAPEELMGGYSGIREMLYGGATFIGSFASGFIIDALYYQANLPFTTIIIAMSIGVSILRLIAASGFIMITESMVTDKET
jgi:MFS family permease